MILWDGGDDTQISRNMPRLLVERTPKIAPMQGKLLQIHHIEC